ncbi:hypothetical protein [Morganella morganii IS15]|nr:hypothetical protein [Morganella morganii IS15]
MPMLRGNNPQKTVMYITQKSVLRLRKQRIKILKIVFFH